MQVVIEVPKDYEGAARDIMEREMSVMARDMFLISMIHAILPLTIVVPEAVRIVMDKPDDDPIPGQISLDAAEGQGRR